MHTPRAATLGLALVSNAPALGGCSVNRLGDDPCGTLDSQYKPIYVALDLRQSWRMVTVAARGRCSTTAPDPDEGKP